MASLKSLLAVEKPLLAPGCYDALTALLVEQAGFKAAYVSGASIAYTKLGRPDIGLVTLSEVADSVARMADRVALPLIVDGDTGFGNALNVQRTVKHLERAGAAAIQLEDQTFPKRCGHLAGKALIKAAEMTGKLKAALDARQSGDTLIIARTDAAGVDGLEAALDRAAAYLETGADVLFIEAPGSLADMTRIGQTFAGKVPLLANMVEGGKSPPLPAGQLAGLGFSLVIFPGAMARVTSFAAQEYLAVLARDGSTASLAPRMHSLSSLNNVIGLEELLALGKRYDG